MGKAAPETTTIAFNAPVREKEILAELAASLPNVRGHSELVRVGYLEWLFQKHPNYAVRIQTVRDAHERNVEKRVAAGVKKRTGNIKKAHTANTIQSPPPSQESHGAGRAAKRILRSRDEKSPKP